MTAAPGRLDLAVTLPDREVHYPIWIGDGLLARTRELLDLRSTSKIVIAADANVTSPWAEKLKESLDKKCPVLEVAPNESNKGIEAATKLWTDFKKAGLDRGSLVVAIGGGMTLDLVAFAASTYMRGVAFLHCPTSLLSQVDASIGGKTGINFEGIKNLVGTFCQPKAVIIDVATLATLPDREMRSGLAEVIKHALVYNASYFDQIGHALDRNEISKPAVIEALIRTSCEIKMEIVKKDPHEGGLRKILNFGHTVGHAFEAIALERGPHLLHGEAVAIGMLAEAFMAMNKGMISEMDLQNISKILIAAGLPVRFPEPVPVGLVLEKMRADKKNLRGAIKFSLLDGIGSCVFDEEIDEEHVIEALIFAGASGRA